MVVRPCPVSGWFRGGGGAALTAAGGAKALFAARFQQRDRAGLHFGGEGIELVDQIEGAQYPNQDARIDDMTVFKLGDGAAGDAGFQRDLVLGQVAVQAVARQALSQAFEDRCIAELVNVRSADDRSR